MGGAANNIQRGLTAVSTFGLSEVPGKIGNTAKNTIGAINPISQIGGMAVRTGAGIQTMANAPRDAAKIAADAAAEQNRLAAAAEAKLAIQPKKTASDDFLANKNKLLQNMRLGLASSVGTAAGAAAPSLTAPALSGKLKLGS